MSGRYVVDNDWETRSEALIVDDLGKMFAIVFIETATLTDTRGGYRYDDGAYRVNITISRKARNHPKRPKVKTFKGEMAWSKAENYARECVSTLQAMLDDFDGMAKQ